MYQYSSHEPDWTIWILYQSSILILMLIYFSPDSFSTKSPPEIIAVSMRAITFASKANTPRHEFAGGFNSPAQLGHNSPAQFGLNSPAHFGIDSPRTRSTAALSGGCSPEMSAVQWGLTGSQNLFSDSWNATPSPRCLQQTKNVDFNSTAGKLCKYLFRVNFIIFFIIW